MAGGRRVPAARGETAPDLPRRHATHQPEGAPQEARRPTFLRRQPFDDPSCRQDRRLDPARGLDLHGVEAEARAGLGGFKAQRAGAGRQADQVVGAALPQGEPVAARLRLARGLDGEHRLHRLGAAADADARRGQRRHRRRRAEGEGRIRAGRGPGPVVRRPAQVAQGIEAERLAAPHRIGPLSRLRWTLMRRRIP